MQGLSHYDDSPSPPSSSRLAGPSVSVSPPHSATEGTRSHSAPLHLLYFQLFFPHNGDTAHTLRFGVNGLWILQRRDNGSTAASSSSSSARQPPSTYKSRTPAGVKLPRSSASASPSPSILPPPAKRPRRSHSPPPENLTQVPQADSDGPPPVTDADDPFAGLSDEEIFRIATRPDEIEGVEDWGMAPEVDPEEASPAIKAKVAQFLRLKYERNQHINTSLLSSTSFANPHIYAKLVEFVALDERATAFPSGGWLTRRNLEFLIPAYGPKSLSDQQKAKQEAVRKSQEAGRRSAIDFAPARHGYDDRAGKGKDRARDRDRESGRERGRDRDGDRRYGEGLERRDRAARALGGIKGSSGASSGRAGNGSRGQDDRDRGVAGRWDRGR